MVLTCLDGTVLTSQQMSVWQTKNLNNNYYVPYSFLIYNTRFFKLLSVNTFK